MNRSLENLLRELAATPGKSYLFCGSRSLDSLVGFVNGASYIEGNRFIDGMLRWLKDQTPKYFHNGVWWDLSKVYRDQHQTDAANGDCFGQAELLWVIEKYLETEQWKEAGLNGINPGDDAGRGR